MIKVGSDFSGIGAFNQALMRLGIKFDEVFACDKDKFARKSFIANYGEPKYFPDDVYDREIPNDPLDIYMTSPPCQAFSQAGKRMGKLDKRGILFFNSYEFIMKNKPRFFIFENVKGLLSHDSGKTFQEWINYLGGKSINGVPVIFPIDEAAPYHIYYKVLNATDFNIPQNRERIFIVGIQDDQDNVFSWPHEQHLTRRLKDILETEVDKKYFLTETALNRLLRRNFSNAKVDPEIAGTINTKNNSPQCSFDSGPTLVHGFGQKILYANDVCPTVISGGTAPQDKAHIVCVGNVNPSGNGMNGNVFDSNGISPTLNTNKGEGIKILQVYRGNNKGGTHDNCPTISANSFEQNNVLCIPVLTPDRPEKRQNGRRFKENGDPSFTITTQDRHGIYDGMNIRRLTPLECWRLMDFPDVAIENAIAAGVSDSQLYKQAGNSICVGVLAGVIKGMKKLCVCLTQQFYEKL